MPVPYYSAAALAVASLLALSPVSLANTPEPQGAKVSVSTQIAAGPLAKALNQLSRQAKATISYQQADVRGFRVNALSGSYSTGEALNTLLQGTGLHAIKVGDNAWVIETTSKGLTVFDTVEVRAGYNKVEDQVYRESSSVEILSQETIERFRGTSVGDIFQGTTGVLVSENRNSGGLDVNIRGMQGQGRVPIIVDGSRQETTVYRGYSGVSSRSYIDADLISTMRIDKGPVLSAEGTGATGGLVNVSTLNAEDIIKPDNQFGMRLRVGAMGNSSDAPEPGTYAGYYLPRNAYRSDCRFSYYCTPEFLMPDSFAPESGMDRPGLLDFNSFSGSLAVGGYFEHSDMVIAYAKRDQGNYYAGKNGPAPKVVVGEPLKLPWYKETPVAIVGASPFRAEELIPNTNFSNESWLLKSNIYLNDEQNLTFSYLRYDSEYGEMMPSQIRSFGQARQWLDSEVLNQTYTAKYTFEPVDNDLIDLKFNLWHTDTLTVLNTPSPGSIEIEGNTRRSDDYQRFGADISNRSVLSKQQQISLDYGLSGQWEKMETDTPEDSGFYTGSRAGRRNEFSAFINGQWQPWPQWTFDVGIRYTRFDSKDNNPLPLSKYDPACRPDGNDGCLPVYYENDQDGFAPIVSVTYEPITDLQIYLRYAEALRMPSLFESTSGWSVSPALDIPLKAEHAKNWELGVNYQHAGLLNDNDALKIKMAYFLNHVDDYLTRTQPNAWEVTNGQLDFFRLRNIDKLELHGFELNVDYDTGLWFTQLSGTYYDHIEVCNVGSYVRYYCNDWGLTQSYINNMIPPNWHANAVLGLRLFNDALELGARGTFMGERNSIPRYNAPTGFNKPVLWHSYNLLDIYASYQLTESASIEFNIDNLTDQYYLDALSLGLVPAPGRTARLNLTLEF